MPVSRNILAPIRPSPPGGNRDVEKFAGPSKNPPPSTKQILPRAVNRRTAEAVPHCELIAMQMQMGGEVYVANSVGNNYDILPTNARQLKQFYATWHGGCLSRVR